jgi:sigma-B regulation protein RsbU (phosphoserine phosphatase)
MARFRDLPIRSKLMTGFMLTSVVALLLTMAALSLYDRETFKRKLLADLSALGGIVAENSISPLVFNDRETAHSVLAALKAQPHVVGAFVFDDKGHPFASFTPQNAVLPPAALPRDGARIDNDGITVVQPIVFNGVRAGTIWLRSDLSELAARRSQYFTIAGLVIVGAAIVALILAALFQRSISRPILRLLETEKRVSREKDYSLRVEKDSEDEVGKLIDGFNEMLSEIRVRDAEIQQRHDQEVALARNIQTSVLPKSFDLEGFDISAVMMPAEEVGGDFYEFRPIAGGGAWLGVGDVTGHGVTSGLIMMMAQSMFTVLCEESRNGQASPSPSEFLVSLNKAMFYNLRARLEQDKFMTMVVARIHADGRLVFAGAHTDLLVYRAKDHSVERIATEGLWLGVAEDIDLMTFDSEVRLGRGDVALFHTDGVTEARNAAGEFYDLDRLTQQLIDLHRIPAADIVTTIANTAWRWAGTPTDDVSLMAVKRN